MNLDVQKLTILNKKTWSKKLNRYTRSSAPKCTKNNQSCGKKINVKIHKYSIEGFSKYSNIH